MAKLDLKKLGFWAKLMWSMYKKPFINGVIEYIDKQVSNETSNVEVAKLKICSKVQSYKKIPGTIRGWVEDYVADISAADIAILKTILAKYLKSL